MTSKGRGGEGSSCLDSVGDQLADNQFGVFGQIG
jgi:hypothetical protein